MNKIFLLPLLLFFPESHSIEYKNFSMKDLGYQDCSIFKVQEYLGKYRNQNYSSNTLYQEDMEIIPDNFKYEFLDSSCGRLVKKSGLDFNKKVEIFYKKHQKTLLPSCKNQDYKDNCFAEGKVYNGYYIGEWLDNKQHGIGIQLVTFNFPLKFFFQNREAIYEGNFYDGYFSGSGKYENGDEGFEGSWKKGEMHGNIEWKYPDFYIYGLELEGGGGFFERDANGFIVIQKVIPFSAAANAGINEGDSLSKIETPNEVLNTNEKGIKNILAFLKQIDEQTKIKFHINGRLLLIDRLKEALFEMNGEVTQSEINRIEERINSDFLTEEEKAEAIKYFYDSYEKIVEIDKISTTPHKLSQYLCTTSRNASCFKEAKYKNIFYRKNREPSRSSYLMGLQHAYNNSDPTIYNNEDGSLNYKLHCRGKGPAYTAFGTAFLSPDESLKNITPDAFRDENKLFFGESFFAPCDNRLPGAKWYLFFPELLLEDEGAISEITKFDLLEIDIISYLEEAIGNKDFGRPVDNDEYGFCNIPIIRNNYCFSGTDLETTYQYDTIRKIANTKGTALYEYNNKNRLLRGEHNYIIASHCLKNGKPAPTRNAYGELRESRFDPGRVSNCLHGAFNDSNLFWECVDRGDSYSYCNKYKPNFISDFKRLNAEFLENIDFKEWIF